ncbi:hypothetical protein J2X69_000217 [Algoriphagus sp. 4150]|uniref:hypothetical protein n=1 Tax=Algoriphagus sp. 4150 TaxID=2817756 RepID=UPI00285A0C12|nr:hypothetical protein [Algoriphagus sp. 4150]MDR7127889.1 hypothetical protein [Algoriphagus sp. 4150]
MINYFRKMLTGYKRSLRLIDGEAVTFYYVGQMVRFSPVSMLRELVLKKEMNSFVSNRVELDASQVLAKIWPKKGQLTPRTKVKMNCGDSQLKVYRYAAKVDQVNVSHYEFYINKELAGIFNRKYDYGRSFTSTVSQLRPELHPLQVKIDEKYLLRDGSSGSQVIIEFFGHTQVWMIFKEAELQQLVSHWDLKLKQKQKEP